MKFFLLFLCLSAPLLGHGQAGVILDPTFNSGTSFNNAVTTTLTLPNGKILVGGTFTQYNGINVRGLVRLNPDGSIDNTFETGAGFQGFGGEVNCMFIDSNGKIWVGGKFSTYNGVVLNGGLVRLSPDGGLEFSLLLPEFFFFHAHRMVRQPNGGCFVFVQGYLPNGSFAYNRLIRLDEFGNIDGGFTANQAVANLYPFCMALQPDGKILLGGIFDVNIDGKRYQNLLRLNTNGSIDPSFETSLEPNSIIHDVVVQADGQIVIAGSFTEVQGVPIKYVARLASNGNLDSGFNPSSFYPDVVGAEKLHLLADGTLLIPWVLSRSNVVLYAQIGRVFANGRPDQNYSTVSSNSLGFSSSDVNISSRNSERKITVGGRFDSFNGVSCLRIARLIGGVPRPPVISAFSPSSGIVGSTVTISGDNLNGTSAVRFNGLNAASFTINSNNQVTAVVPPGASSGPISVVSPDGTVTSTVAFNVLAPPQIGRIGFQSFVPSRTYTIDGKNFLGTTAVSINGTNATFNVFDNNRLSFTVPPAATTGKLRVTNPAGTATTTYNLHIFAPISITNISPLSGPPGTVVTVTGSGFASANQVNSSRRLVVDSDTLLRTTIDESSLTGPVSVFGFGGFASSSQTFTLPASISAISPAVISPGSRVTITGTGLAGATAVYFQINTRPWQLNAPSFTIDGPTQITAQVPNGLSSGTIIVNTPSGTASFAYQVPISITDFSPTNGPPGTIITINGSGFVGVTSLTYGLERIPITQFSVLSPTQISAMIPASAVGIGNIVVNTLSASASSRFAFWVPFPTISGFSPASGPPGTVVTILGNHFYNRPQVSFGGVKVTNLTVNSPTQLTVTVPPGAIAGPITIEPADNFCCINNSSNSSFGIPISITSFSPGQAAVGSQVTITGSNFSGVSTVRFGGVEATAVTVLSPTQVRATVPPKAKSGVIQVGSPSLGFANSGELFMIPVNVEGFSPNITTPGGSITITGSGFTGATGVAIGGVNANFVVNNDAQITATIPVLGNSWWPQPNVRVVTPRGEAENDAPLFLRPPAILSFGPTGGIPGSSVTLTGGYFSGATAVNFNGLPAQFSLVNDAQIVATVPQDARSGPISVTVTNLNGTSATKFDVQPRCPPTLIGLAGTTWDATTRRLTKVADPGWGNGTARSQEAVPANANGWVEWEIPAITPTFYMAGLSSAPSGGQWAGVEYGIYYAVGQIYVYHVSTGVQYSGRIAKAGDRLRVWKQGDRVNFYHNGTPMMSFYEYHADPALPLYFDVAFFSTGASLTNVSSSLCLPAPPPPCNLAWANIAGATFSGNTLTKTASPGWGNAGATSATVLPAGVDGGLSWTIPTGPLDQTFYVLGLSATSPDNSWASVQYGIFYAAGQVYVVLDGQNQGYFGNVQPGDRLAIRRTGSTVSFQRNNKSFFGAAAPAGTVLRADLAMFSSGARVQDLQGTNMCTQTGRGEELTGGPVLDSPQASESDGISAYPNPTGGELKVIIKLANPRDEGNLLVEVYNGLGQRVHEQQVGAQTSQQVTVDLTELPRGVYVVRVSGRYFAQGLRVAKD
jgi:uncharacterized delta-60 repeat protein